MRGGEETEATCSIGTRLIRPELRDDHVDRKLIFSVRYTDKWLTTEHLALRTHSLSFVCVVLCVLSSSFEGEAPKLTKFLSLHTDPMCLSEIM